MLVSGRPDIAGQTAYNVTPDVDVSGKPDRPSSWFVHNEHADHEVYVSFDGTTDHLILTPGQPTESMSEKQGFMKAWFRVAAGAAGAVHVYYVVD
ncbi:MAG: hypothetical protein ACYDAR_14240 [Thermomicrobiales bacterium]